MISEETYYVVDSLGVSHPETIERARVTLPQLFVEGGLGWMIGISLFLIAMLIAAWKAPRWVREIGIGALIFAIFGTLMGLLQILNVLQMFGIPTFYGFIVYFISLIIRVIQKPRI